MNALSLFNGISGLHLALDRAGIEVNQVYYSEIDKFANKVTEHHYPDDIALGDVTKWKDWDIDWSSIDLVGAGFPCQSWSVAGKQLGDKDDRGMLFWITLDIIAHVLKHNPNAKFLMENVKMKKDFEEYITHHTTAQLGYVEKTLINSALVSAQNRNRYYWTNFKVKQPENKNIKVIDILDEPFDGNRDCVLKDEYIINPESINRIGTTIDINGHDLLKRVYSFDGKSPTLTANSGGNQEPKFLMRNEKWRKITHKEYAKLQTFPSWWCDMIGIGASKKVYGNAWTVDVISHILKGAF